MTAAVPEHHTAEYWAAIPRSVQGFTVTTVVDGADFLTITGDHGWTFMRSKADLGRDIAVGEELWIETVKLSQITGLRDQYGWLFRLTNEELADQARQFSEDLHHRDNERLQDNRDLYESWERDLPEWLQARIRNFHERGGEHFQLTGWGYELIICRLAALFDAEDEAGAEALASEVGASGNQWNCAKLLASARAQHGDSSAVAVPAGIAPITGSVDYS